jgi:predicted nucleic acid-binding Zn ribbon protein
VCNDVLGVTVTLTQVYNHMRKWRLRWAMMHKVKNVLGVAFCSERCAIMMDKEQLKSHLMMCFAYHFFVEHAHSVIMNSTNEMSSHF